MFGLFFLLYLVIGIPFAIHESRVTFHEKLQDVGANWYAGDGSPRRTEEERLRYIAGQCFWPGFFTGMVWPLRAVVWLLERLHDVASNAIASKEIKAARQRAIEAKAQEILKEFEQQEKEKFKDL